MDLGGGARFGWMRGLAIAVAFVLGGCSAEGTLPPVPPEKTSPATAAPDPPPSPASAAPAPSAAPTASSTPTAGSADAPPQELPPPQPASLAQADRDEMARLALDLALVARQIPDHALLKDPKHVVVSTENLPAPPPRLDGVELLPMSADAVQAKADREGDFVYIVLGAPEAHPKGIRLSIHNRWAIGAASKKAGKIFLSGGGMSLLFHKEGGAWKVDVVAKFIS